jgi:hypothetical protein
MVFPGLTPASSRTVVSAGQRDLYVCKMDCNRNLIWKNTIGGTGNDGGKYVLLKVRYDKNKHIYTTGSFRGTATFSTTLGTAQILTSNGGDDIFIAKYDTAGILIWVVKSGGTGHDEGLDCSFDKFEKVLNCGVFRSTNTFGTKTGSTISLSSSGGEDAYVSKYDTNGTLIWVIKGGGS